MENETEKTSEKEVSYLLNMPEALKEKLIKIAKVNNRNLKGQVIHFLEAGIKDFEKGEEAPNL